MNYKCKGGRDVGRYCYYVVRRTVVEYEIKTFV